MRLFKLFALIAVSSFLFACGDDGGFFVPAVGNKTIVANGGSATFGNGGAGGGIDIDVYGDVKVRNSGTLNTSFTIPTYDYHFGANGVTVSADTTVEVVTEVPAAGTLFMNADDPNLYLSDGETGIPVTGLKVNSGVTLTLQSNYDGYAYLGFEQSVEINGTVTVAAEGDGLYLYSGSLMMIGKNGVVTTRPATAGADAGFIYLYAYGTLINKGLIDTGGAAATEAEDQGGNAGPVFLYSDYGFLYNTGTILAVGGNSAAWGGGNGGNVELVAYSNSIFSSGDINSSGGNSSAGGGGSGNYISFYAGSEYMGHLVVSGHLTANGGSGAGTDGDGGAGGYIYLENNGGKLWSSATVSTRGGASAASYGGDAGYYYIYSDYGYDYEWDNYTETEGIKLTGNIDCSGGDGVLGGGAANWVYIYNSYSGYGNPPYPAVELIGYKNFTLNGGAGANGGQGGYYYIYTYNWWTNYDSVGYIFNSVPVTLNGGEASGIDVGAGRGASGWGGEGGYVYFETADYSAHDKVTVTNKGAIEAVGGAGTYGGNSGSVLFYGYDGVTNNAAINVQGGAGTVDAGYSSYVEFYSSYDVVNTGAIKGVGGYGGESGNLGCDVYMFAVGQVINSAAINANGGDSGGTGGDGGYIDLWSQQDPTKNTGKLTVFGGDGVSADGNIGEIWIDAVDVTPI